MRKLNFKVEFKELNRVAPQYRDKSYDEDGTLIPVMSKIDVWDRSFKAFAKHDLWMLEDIVKGKRSNQTKTLVFYVNGQGQLDTIVWDRFEYPTKITKIFPGVLCYMYKEDYYENSLPLYVVDNILIKKFMPGLLDEFKIKNNKGSYTVNNITAEYSFGKNTVYFTKYVKELDMSIPVEQLKEKLMGV